MKKKMLAYISQVVKSCGQVPLGRRFGEYKNLLWDNDRGVLLQTLDNTFEHLEGQNLVIVKRVYDDLQKDFPENPKPANGKRKNAKPKAAATNKATWKDLDWREKWRIIDHVLAYVGQRVDTEQKTHGDALAKHYDIATEARYSEAGTVISIIQGMRNSPDVLEKELDKQL